MRIIWKGKWFTKQKVWCPICDATLKVDARDVIERRAISDRIYVLRFKCKHCKREFEVGELQIIHVCHEFHIINNKAKEYERD